MDKPIIEVTNLGKKYDIAHMRGGYIALRDVIATIFKNPFSFMAHKAKQAVGLEKREEFWALRGVNFSVKRGEVIGVIGRNGAGKSTLLKILSQITPPTEGEVTLRGRVGSLLEVGTGFHPELSGRENIFLNGAILGMKRAEIAAKFNQIVQFAGVEKFLDTPVKYYSSGMYVRLAFSVAAHMEPDILVVDEVLAVGDAEFQKKCLGKMNEITHSEGRTILFVSHNMAAIENLCERTIMLKGGRVAKIGPTAEVIEAYLKDSSAGSDRSLKDRVDRQGNLDLKMTDTYLLDEDGQRIIGGVSGKDLTFAIEYECKPGKQIPGVVIGLSVESQRGEGVFLCHTEMTKKDFGIVKGRGRFECTVPKLPLVPANYSVSVRIISGATVLDFMENVISFDVHDGDFFGTGSSIKHSDVYVKHSWKNKPEPAAKALPVK